MRYALASYADIHGRSKCKMVPIGHLDQMLDGSELFTGAALDGVPQEVNDEEVCRHPDPASAHGVALEAATWRGLPATCG